MRRFSKNILSATTYSSAIALSIALPLQISVFAQEEADQEDSVDPNKSDNDSNEIIVTGARIKGSVDTEIKPEEELNEADIASLGASSVSEIVDAIAPQTSSGRGRGGGRPIFLINGQRISSFRDLRNLPPEAIRRVQVFPEELSLQYGFRPDQRVLNFILKSDFASFNLEQEFGAPQSGGYSAKESEVTFTRIGEKSRLNIDIEYENTSMLTENERDIIAQDENELFGLSGIITAPNGGEIDPAYSAIIGQSSSSAIIPTGNSSPNLNDFAANSNAIGNNDLSQFRTLVSPQDRFEASAALSYSLAPQTTLGLNGSFELIDRTSLLGLPSATLSLPASNPSSPFANDVLLTRSFLFPQPLESRRTTKSLKFGSSFNSLIGDWRWSLTSDYNNSDQDQSTNQNADFIALQNGLNDGSINPFASDFGSELSFLNPNISNSNNQTLSIRNSFAGIITEIPSGPIRITFAQNYAQQWLNSLSIIANNAQDTSLSRRNISTSINADIPLVDRDIGALGFIGKLSLNGNFGYSDLSDFGGLTDYSVGLRWEPSETLSLQASYIFDEKAPGIGNIGNPITITPNARFFDISRNETVLIDLISGGNPNLRAEQRRDIKISLSWRPKGSNGPSFQSEFFRNSSNNITEAFPLLTPEIEAAFPSRVTRDSSGRLTSVDRRSVTYDEFRSQSFRNGFSWSGRLGSQRRGRPTSAGRPSAGERPNASTRPNSGRRAEAGGGRAPQAEARPNGNRPTAAKPNTAANGSNKAARPASRRGGGRRAFGGRPSRWFMSIFHTYRIQEEVLIRPGVPILDRLNGSSAGFFGSTPKHAIQLSGGLFANGLGLRLNGTYRSATTLDSSGVVGSNNLRFSDQMAMNGSFFVNLDNRGNLTKKLPFLKGSRVRLRINNIFNDYIKVTDENGDRPVNYQRGLIDPQGRFFEISFRKRF